MKITQSLRIFYVLLLLNISSHDLKAQILKDSIQKIPWYNFHFQSTVISQQHPGFHAKYSGMRSLDSTGEVHTSISMTLYFAARLWKSASVYFNPELSGGEGFSQTTGVAGFPNGEVYRVSDPRPHIYIARLYFRQVIPLTEETVLSEDGINILPGSMPKSYLAVEVGKFSLMDFFDNNQFSHDPRTQFFNWALMGNGAWDYAANTRGYTYGINFELVRPDWALKFASVTVPMVENGSEMNFNLIKEGSECLEFTRNYSFGNQKGAIRLVAYVNRANMGSYQKSVEWGLATSKVPNVDSVAGSGKTKLGFGINIEHELSKTLGLFLRAGWNDGRNETWVFTEIDRSISAGISIDGSKWNRNNDSFGFAQIINGLSPDHRNYLKAGGYGFIIGDGHLNYGLECISELYYSYSLKNSHMALSPDYQLIINPAYNKDRGPVHVFGMRMHIEF
jgi:high affinity Mn2+ porin